jgi:hypothetical protein
MTDLAKAITMIIFCVAGSVAVGAGVRSTYRQGRWQVSALLVGLYIPLLEMISAWTEWAYKHWV